MKKFLKKSFLYLVLPCMLCFAPYTAKAEDLLGEGDMGVETTDPFQDPNNDLVAPPVIDPGSGTVTPAPDAKVNPGTGDLNGVLIVSGVAISFGLAVVIKKYKNETVN